MAYTSVAKIANIRLKLHKVLPAVYDESLSYLEGLAKLTFKVNETIDSVNALNDNVSALNDSVTDLDSRVTKVEGEIDTFEQEVERRFAELMSEIDAKVDLKLAEVDAHMDAIDVRIDVLENSVNAKIAELEDYVRTTLANIEDEFTRILNEALSSLDERFGRYTEEMTKYIKKEIDDALAKIPEITSVMVIDPTNGFLVPIQTALYNIVEYASYGALTVDEFNRLGLTVNELNSLMVNYIPRGFTCTEWMKKGKDLLLKQLDAEKVEEFARPHEIVRDYLDGTKVWHDRNVDINWMMWATSGCYSCDELAALEFTVDEIIAFNCSCEDFELRGNSIMVRSA